MTYQNPHHVNMQDQSNCHSNGKGDRHSISRFVLHGAIFVCLFEIGQALVGYIWATRHKLFERDLLWEVAEVCGSSKETKFETVNMMEML